MARVAINNIDYQPNRILRDLVEYKINEIKPKYKQKIIEFYVSNDDMANELNNGDSVKIDVNRKNLQNPNQKDIYLISIDDEKILCRLKPINNSYIPIFTNKNINNSWYENLPFKIIGKVVQ